jgi:hypothetical protein
MNAPKRSISTLRPLRALRKKPDEAAAVGADPVSRTGFPVRVSVHHSQLRSTYSSSPFPLMASLARLRSRLPLKTTGRLSVSSLKILIGVGPHIPCSLLPARCRPRPTRHNLPNQYRKILLRHSRSNSMKTLSELSTPTHLPSTSRSPKIAFSKCTRRWSQCVAWSSPLMRCTRASSSVVSAISPLARCALCALLSRVSPLTYHIVPYFLPSRKPSQSALSHL